MIPWLPKSDITFAALSGQYEQIGKIEQMGIRVLRIPTQNFLPNPVCSHADLVLHDLGDGQIICADPALYTPLKALGYSVLPISKPLGRTYPADCALDAARIGNYTFCNPLHTDLVILNHGETIVPVKQGYAKCSMCIVDETAFITSDKGLYEAGQKLSMKVLLIRPGYILLPGYTYGFIGGAGAKISKNIMLFTGDLFTHPDAKKIEVFLKERDVAIRCLPGPLTDIGGILPLV